MSSMLFTSLPRDLEASVGRSGVIAAPLELRPFLWRYTNLVIIIIFILFYFIFTPGSTDTRG